MNNLPAGCQYDPSAPWNLPDRNYLLPHEIREIEEECEAVILKVWGEDWGHNDVAIEAYEKLLNKTLKEALK